MLIQPIKDRINASLKPVREELGLRGALRFALKTARSIKEDSTTESALEKLYWIITTIMYHERGGGLKPREIASLITFGEGLVRLLKVRLGKIQNGSVVSEWNLILGQLERRQGSHVSAAWHHELAIRNAGKDLPSEFTVGRINRLMRLGNCEHALDAICELERRDGQATAPSLKLMRVRCLALQQRFDEALTCIGHILEFSGLTQEYRDEALWEAKVLDYRKSGDFRPLMVATRPRDGSHSNVSYCIDAALWCFSQRHASMIESLPNIRAFKRRKGEFSRNLNTIWDAAASIQELYDNGIDINLRLDQAGKLIAKADCLFKMESQLLVLAATRRWLSRSKLRAFEVISATQYSYLSRMVSDSKTDDALGLGWDGK